MPAPTTIRDAIAAIRPPDEPSRDAARHLQSRLTKPTGALGRLEELHIWAAGVFRHEMPSLARKVVAVAAADHGVAEDGVSAYPQNVTWQMVRNFLDGGAAINVLAAHARAEVRIVDAGVRDVNTASDSPGETNARIEADARKDRSFRRVAAATDLSVSRTPVESSSIEAAARTDTSSRSVAAETDVSQSKATTPHTQLSQSPREERLHVARLRGSTSNMTRGPAMSRDEAETLVARGIDFARELCAAGPAAICLGDMGIGNTTAAAAITAVLTGTPPRVTAGRGTGIDDATFDTKVRAIGTAIALNEPDPLDPLDVLAKIGGFEIAFLTGVTIGAAASRSAVILDGYPTTAAALIAAALAPASLHYMLASHMSVEPGHRIALAHLGLRPLLELDMRLGEGTGAALALSLLEAALRLPREMATFDSAGVSRSDSELQPEA